VAPKRLEPTAKRRPANRSEACRVRRDLFEDRPITFIESPLTFLASLSRAGGLEGDPRAT
jgi:hypothetical protein